MKQFVRFNILVKTAIAALVVLASSALLAQVSGTVQFSKTLAQVKVHAAQAQDDAAVLESYARSSLAWPQHAQCLENVRVHVNDLNEDFTKLQSLRPTATPSQRVAIDRIDPLLLDLAASLTATVKYVNENNHYQGAMKDPAFHSRIESDLAKINAIYKAICDCPES